MKLTDIAEATALEHRRHETMRSIQLIAQGDHYHAASVAVLSDVAASAIAPAVVTWLKEQLTSIEERLALLGVELDDQPAFRQSRRAKG
jgi:hypothetical protein